MNRLIEAHSHEFDPKMMAMLQKKGFEKVFLMHKDPAFIARSIKSHPDFVVGFGWLPMWEGVSAGLAAIDRFRSAGCTGVKICFSCCSYDDEQMMPVYEKAYKCGLPVSFHTGWLWVGNRKERSLPMWYHPFTLDRVATAFPKLKILMNHMGHPWIKEGAYIVKNHPNVYADLCISRDYTWDPDYFWHEIGGDVNGYNVLFKTLLGSDALSIQSYEHYLHTDKLLTALKVSPAIKQRAYYKNALEFIGQSGDEKRTLEISGKPVKTGRFVDFGVERYGETVKAGTDCSVSYDDKGITLSFNCIDKNASKVNITSEGVPEQIWQDDCVEIFLAESENDYLHFTLNPKGQVGCDKNRFTKVDFAGKAKGAIKRGAWAVEVFVPFSMFTKKPSKGDAWGFNMMRSKKTAPKETSMWNEVTQTFHNREGFGKLIFK